MPTLCWRSLRTTHAIAAVVAEVAVAVADGDAAAVVAAGGVALEAGELRASQIDRAAVLVDLEGYAGTLQTSQVDFAVAALGHDLAIERFWRGR